MSGFQNEVVNAKGIDLSGDTVVSNKLGTDGFLYIGNSSGNPVATLPISTNSSLTITPGAGSLDLNVDLSGLPTVATIFSTDSGNATPVSNVLNFLGDVNVQTSASSNTITISSLSQITSKTSNYTLQETDFYLNCTSNSFIVTLPPATSLSGKIYQIKNTGTGTITIDGDGSETIDNETTQTLIQDESMTLICDGNNWFII